MKANVKRYVMSETPYARHIEKHFDEIVGEHDNVLHEKVSQYVHTDVHIIQPTNERQYYTLYTTGMSGLPMCKDKDIKYAELVMFLPMDANLVGDIYIPSNKYARVILDLINNTKFPFAHSEPLLARHDILHNSGHKYEAGIFLSLADKEWQSIDVYGDKINLYVYYPITKNELQQEVYKDLDKFLMKRFGKTDGFTPEDLIIRSDV